MSRISIPRFILPKRIYKQIIFRFLCWRISYDFYLDSYERIDEHNKGFISYPACWKENVGSRGCHACCCLMASLLESLYIVKMTNKIDLYAQRKMTEHHLYHISYRYGIDDSCSKRLNPCIAQSINFNALSKKIFKTFLKTY